MNTNTNKNIFILMQPHCNLMTDDPETVRYHAVQMSLNEFWDLLLLTGRRILTQAILEETICNLMRPANMVQQKTIPLSLTQDEWMAYAKRCNALVVSTTMIISAGNSMIQAA